MNRPITVAALLALFLQPWLPRQAVAEQEVTLRNGFVLRGSVLELASLNKDPFALGAGAGNVAVTPIWMIDDGLRRTYVFRPTMIAGANPVEDIAQRIELWQPSPLGGKAVAGLGSILAVSPFNEFGRRIVNVRGPEGDPLSIIQGITEINARYAKIEGLRSTPSYIWDMRVSTNSIPADQLKVILNRRIDQSSYDQRLEVIRFYVEGQRYGEARNEIERAMKDFPNEKRLPTQLTEIVSQQGAQLLKEAQVRKDAGQYQIASDILRNFPVQESARVTRIEVQDALQAIEGKVSDGKKLAQQLRAQITEHVANDKQKVLLGLCDEIDQQLSLDTLSRLSDYTRLGGVDNIPVFDRIALGIGGWLMGSGAGLPNLDVVTSLIEVRALVFEYLGCQNADRRTVILNQLRGMEFARPEYVSKMLPGLPPPLPLPDEAKLAAVGMYNIDQSVRGTDVGQYVVQLPPEYNPLRAYPCIVALHPIGATAEAQIDFWSGPPSADGSIRMGQGARHGFVVVAPRWTRLGQQQYESTPREHAEVLSAVRDAMRRVSIDSDRVFIAGLGGGGSAAWDIAASHPDQWAGMISVSGEPNQYLRHYTQNMSYVPSYLVMGEIAGTPAPLVRQGDVLDDYMAPGFDAMVVMYRGRGPEHFYEEIHHLFRWMMIHKRTDPPKKIEAATMRAGDQYFWWVEMPQLLPNVVIDPFLWEQAERLRAGVLTANVGEDNQIRISQGPAEQFIVWLSPNMGLDMTKPVVIRYRSRTIKLDFDDTLDVMLEDARTRAERKRPYWAQATVP